MLLNSISKCYVIFHHYQFYRITLSVLNHDWTWYITNGILMQVSKVGPQADLPSKFNEGPQNVKTKGPNGPWNAYFNTRCVKDIEKPNMALKIIEDLQFFNTRGPNGPWNFGPYTSAWQQYMAWSCYYRITCTLILNSWFTELQNKPLWICTFFLA